MTCLRHLTRCGFGLLAASSCLAGDIVHAQSPPPITPWTMLPEHPAVTADAFVERSRPVAGQPASGAPIRMLFVYSAEANALHKDRLAPVLEAVSDINESFARDEIDASVEIAHIYASTDSESGALWSDLKSLRDAGDGRFDFVHGIREQFSADVVVLITERSDGCGVAFPGATAANAFAVVNFSCMENNYSAAHELGHILGAGHQPEWAVNPNYTYGHGFQNVPEGVRSIMAMPCRPQWSCTRINRWSGPGEDGLLGDALTSNNRRVVEARAAIVAGFR